MEIKQRNGMVWEQIGPNTYTRWNPLVQKRVTVTFDHANKQMHVREDQPREVVQAILDANVAQQNEFRRYGEAPLHQTTRLPAVVHRQIMEQCGFKPGQGYDQTKFRQIVNDRDYYKLKTVPGRV